MRESVCPPRRMRFSFETRCRIVQLIRSGWSPSEAAEAFGASRATGYRLWARYQAEGWAGLIDRSSVPRSQPRKLSAEQEQRVLDARAFLNAGPVVVAAAVQMPVSTVGKVLRRHGRSRLPQPQRVLRPRYERKTAGELLHIDTKKLGRFHVVGKRILKDGVHRNPHAGWEYLHVAVDDHTRIAYCELLPSERKQHCCAFLKRAVAWYASQGITIERVLTDNAKAYHSNDWQTTSSDLKVAARYTKPYSPWTNGKAEALIKTLLREWAYRFTYPSSHHRAKALPSYLRWYNRRRPHSSIAGPPISRVSHLCDQYS